MSSSSPSDAAVSSEVRRASLELELPAADAEGVLRGYVLFHACEGEGGTCVYRRHDFEVPIEAGV